MEFITFDDFETPSLTLPKVAQPASAGIVATDNNVSQSSSPRTSIDEEPVVKASPTFVSTIPDVEGAASRRTSVASVEDAKRTEASTGGSWNLQTGPTSPNTLRPHGGKEYDEFAERSIRPSREGAIVEKKQESRPSDEHNRYPVLSIRTSGLEQRQHSGNLVAEAPIERDRRGDPTPSGASGGSIGARPVVNITSSTPLASTPSVQRNAGQPEASPPQYALQADGGREAVRPAGQSPTPLHSSGRTDLQESESATLQTSNRKAAPPAISSTWTGYWNPGPPTHTSPPSTYESYGADSVAVNSEHRRPRRPSRPGTNSGSGIRDNSRARSTSSAVNQSGEACDMCRMFGQQRSYCNVCSYTFCDRCWEMQMPHRDKRLALGSIPHEKTSSNIAKKVQDILAPALTEQQREKLHTADIDTTWFGVTRDEPDLPYPLFRDYGRYANLIAGSKEARIDNAAVMSAISDQEETLYPSLVSFVGETGAGKSTLIKLLIDLKSQDSERFPTPVVGASGRDIATSEDVHLYLDPDSSESQAPLLFADCEGLDGGEREPVGARLKRKMERQAAAAGMRRIRRLRHTSERELTWANTPKKKSREFAVAHLYPRLLYTFSDVIVFVLKNPRRIEGVLQRLIEWASAALERSSNQPVLPHAIIALNASENDIPEQLWDVQTATTTLMENLSNAIYHNATFKKYASFWRDRDRQIDTVDQLLQSYYSSVRVVRIPTNGRPNLINEQVEKLSQEIRKASKAARDRKWNLRMLLDADEFQPYLQVAFDHFAENLDEPFDFVQASFTYSPIPNDFGGNILKLAIRVMDCWKDLAKGITIFEELSYMVASCITLDAARNKNKGAVDSIFPLYLEHIDAALENFCDRHWPCEFVGPRGGRCVNVRSGHGAKGHQLKSGKLLAAGDYISAFTAEQHRAKFQDDIYSKMLALREKVRAIEETNVSEVDAAAEVHKNSVLPWFCDHASRGNEMAFISHTVCFCCLFEPPEHPLPCGHIICTSCLRTYGKTHLGRIEIGHCPLEKRERHFRQAWRVTLKPANCGIRILTLDGGGVRGIVELEILKLIEKEFGGRLNIQSFFDLVIGTSTGGIIALGLTTRNWTVDECTTNFETFVNQAFTSRKGMNLPVIGYMVQNYNHSKYETQPLQEALVKAFTEDQYLFGGKRSESGSLDLKVAVTASSAAGKAVVLANYNRLSTEKLSYDFQRPDMPSMELKTWEAARATSAAPTYFKPLCHEASKQVYLDGGLWYNNPIYVADKERRLIWPDQANDEPDIVVSIGTSFYENTKPKRSTRVAGTGILNNYKSRMRLAKDVFASTSDSQKTWRQFVDVRSPTPANKHRYVRLNPELQEPPPKLDEVDQMQRLQELTRYQIADSQQIKTLARRLVASCFYFDPTGGVKEDPDTESFEVTGHINCRFLPGGEITHLGNFIQTRATAGHDAHFVIKEEGNDDVPPQEICFSDRIMPRMIRSGTFRTDKITIRRDNRFSKTEMFLCFTRGEMFPISGFPRCLHSDPPTSTASRHVLTATHSFRWAGRSLSQQQRRPWQPPNLLLARPTEDIIGRYSHSDHLLGNATREDSMNSHPIDPSAELLLEQAVSVNPTTPVEAPTTELFADRFYVATEDWRHPQGVDSHFLAVRKGDLVKMSKMGDQEWWLGRLAHDHTEGWLPARVLIGADSSAAATFRRMEATGTNSVYLVAELGT